MSGSIGRVEILPDPVALAHHVAEWMTQAALARLALGRLDAEDAVRLAGLRQI
jgi:hypothetical protein